MAINVMRTVQQNGPEIGGGVVGVGAPVALREFADVRDGEEVSILGDPDSMLARVTRPSVIWGVGVGGLTGLLWMLDVGPRPLHDFYLTHALTGIPTGVASAALPKEVVEADSQAAPQRVLGERRPDREADEFNPTDGRSPETQPAN